MVRIRKCYWKSILNCNSALTSLPEYRCKTPFFTTCSPSGITVPSIVRRMGALLTVACISVHVDLRHADTIAVLQCSAVCWPITSDRAIPLRCWPFKRPTVACLSSCAYGINVWRRSKADGQSQAREQYRKLTKKTKKWLLKNRWAT